VSRYAGKWEKRKRNTKFEVKSFQKEALQTASDQNQETVVVDSRG
jgi:hypothetical protein